MKSRVVVFIWFAVFVFGHYSCQKTEDVIETYVELISPAENSLIYLPDTLQIKFKIKTEGDIESVNISVVNSNYISLFGTNTIDAPPTDEEVVTTINLKPLQNFDDAPYYIRITVNYHKVKRDIYFNFQLDNKPLVYKGFFLFSSSGIQQTRIDFYNPNLLDSVFLIVQGVYIDSEISSFNNNLYMLTTTPEKLKSFSINNQVLDWEAEPAFPYPAFTDIHLNKDRIYTGMESGQIVGYSQLNGQQQLTTEMMTDSFPEKIHIMEDFIIGDYLSRISGKKTLVTFYKETGVKKQSQPVDIQVVSFATTAYPYQVLIVGNKNQKGIISQYHVQDNYFVAAREIEEGIITTVCEITEGTLLCSIDKGLYLHKYAQNMTIKLIEFQEVPLQIYFEHISRQIIVQFESKLIFLQYPDMEEISIINMDNTLKGLQFYYQYD
ncbi:MAG: hypothetical protein KQH67_06800 [Bacteroidetes bacterium]|nr:hypothetical protein [Bacteroidota bacterium]